MQTIITQKQPVSPIVVPSTENRIIARIVLQAWGGYKGRDLIVLDDKQVDVTEMILRMEHDAVVRLRNNDYGTDMIGRALASHAGPVAVNVTRQICDYFGVDYLTAITPEALEEARLIVSPGLPECVQKAVEMEVTATVLPGSDRAMALNDLPVEGALPLENVIVTHLKRIKPSVDRAPAAVGSLLPRFMQLMTLSNAVSINDGALVTDWATSDCIGEPTNEVLRFSWTDGKMNYSVVLTEEGVESGSFDDNGRFFVTDHEGTLSFVTFFEVEPIGLFNLGDMQ
jgi:hypothetical protein